MHFAKNTLALRSYRFIFLCVHLFANYFFGISHFCRPATRLECMQRHGKMYKLIDKHWHRLTNNRWSFSFQLFYCTFLLLYLFIKFVCVCGATGTFANLVIFSPTMSSVYGWHFSFYYGCLCLLPNVISLPQ